MVIRINVECIMIALSKKITYPLGPLEIEAKAMEEGVHFAWDVGIREVVFECYSMIISEALSSHNEPPTTILNIFERIYHKLQDY